MVEEENEALEVKYPTPVKEHNKLNLIIFGPEKCGKTTLANYLAQEQQRVVIKIDSLFDYCLKRGLPVSQKAQKYLEEREEERKKLVEEQEKKKKTKKVKKGEEEPEINSADYKILTKALLVEMI